MINQQNENYYDDINTHLSESINSCQELEQISDKRHSWITNASIGLLGYFIAILVQFKMNGNIPNLDYAIIIIVYLCFVVLMGIIFKQKYENNIIKSKSLDAILPSLKAIDIFAKHNSPELEKHKKQVQELSSIINQSSENPLTGKINKNYDFFSKQLYFFSLAIILMVVYFGFYLFTK